MNNDTQLENGTFVYYKDILDVDNSVPYPPPQKIRARYPHKWMKTRCNTATPHVGTEVDWMNFYFALHTLGGSAKFLYSPIRDTYRDTCNALGGNGSCTGLDEGDTNPAEDNGPKWGLLTSAVAARYGSTSARLFHWSEQGANFGVNQ